MNRRKETKAWSFLTGYSSRGKAEKNTGGTEVRTQWPRATRGITERSNKSIDDRGKCLRPRFRLSADRGTREMALCFILEQEDH